MSHSLALLRGPDRLAQGSDFAWQPTGREPGLAIQASASRPSATWAHVRPWMTWRIAL